jgi:uncharacterized protein YbdZ (MbtH family)
VFTRKKINVCMLGFCIQEVTLALAWLKICREVFENMSSDQEDDDRLYVVLVNNEEQHCLWLSHKEIPAGWRLVHGPGPKVACREFVEQSWKDMTPLSLRRKVS